MNDGKGPYSGIKIVKEECINHVQKRMGTRLRKLREELKEGEKKKKKGKKTYSSKPYERKTSTH